MNLQQAWIEALCLLRGPASSALVAHPCAVPQHS